MLIIYIGSNVCYPHKDNNVPNYEYIFFLAHLKEKKNYELLPTKDHMCFWGKKKINYSAHILHQNLRLKKRKNT